MSAQSQPTNETNANEFSIQRIYVKDSSFESPHAPLVFREKWEPHIELELQNKAEPLGDDNYEVILKIGVTAKVDNKVAFLAELEQAGIFYIKNFQADQLKPLLGSYCPNILYPYAREAIADLVSRGSFPQLHLAPVNFDLLYQQHEEQMKTQANKKDSEEK